MKISIIGLGRYGKLLGRELLTQKMEILGTTRTLEKKVLLEKEGFNVSLLSYPEIPDDVLKGDILILNIPPFREQLQWFKSWPWNRKAWLIFISSTSVIPQPDSPSGEILKEQEDWIRTYFERPTILRLGGLFSDQMHPGQYLSGRKNLSGRLWPVNLIHLNDAVGATIEVINQKIRGDIIDVVADEHPTREEYYTLFCQKYNLPLPEFNQDDFSTGKIISNYALKKIYAPSDIFDVIDKKKITLHPRGLV
jgi:nucleoside-diphosphate-sugar epimerase